MPFMPLKVGAPHLQTWRDDELQHGGEKLVEIALLPGKMQHHQHPKDLKYTL